MSEIASNADETGGADRDTKFRRLEREWQDDVGQHLLDVPHHATGAAAVHARQFQRIIDEIDLTRPGPVVEIGCGKGHFLAQLAAKAGRALPVGIDVSRAVSALPAKGLNGVRADGEFLPFADESLVAVVYDGALHHLPDYRAGLRDAHRTLVPGGSIILFEPVSSVFSRFIHHLLDPFVFRKVVYESPIDQEYKDDFRESVILETLDELGMTHTIRRTDFLAYPLTGCYAGSAFGRSRWLMRSLLAVESFMNKVVGLRQLGEFLSWRFLLVARKPK